MIAAAAAFFSTQQMIRLFRQHLIRKVEELEGLWDFEPCRKAGEFPEHYRHRLPVPGCWEIHPRFVNYRGVAAYRTHVHVRRTGALRLSFKGVSHTAHVYWNGQFVTSHYNAYTPFEATISRVEAGGHELVVFVHNAFSESSALHIPNDYFTYGGINRPVSIEEIHEVFIERIQFTPFQRQGSWHAAIEVFMRNTGASEASINIELKFGDVIIGSHQTKVPGRSSASFKREHSFKEVCTWSRKNPALYHLQAILKSGNDPDPVDDLIERVGFRTVAVQGNAILLNNEFLKLRGFNRHEDHPSTGSAMTLQMLSHDLDLIEDMGGNMVRTSHYPNDERFLDLCDERGIFVWEENHARGLSLGQMKNPNFSRQCEDCNREMVQNHINHPSIIIWGILNECASNESEGRVEYERQLNQIRKMDGSRPLTFATHHLMKDICLDLVDVVSLNIYSGWYTEDEPLLRFRQIHQWVNSAGGKGKPLIVSEFGASGDYGFRDAFRRVKWSEDRQADILESNLSAYLSCPEISGLIVWQFCDCRVHEDGSWFRARPKGKNDKGIVDEYRRPKLAYAVVKKYFTKG